MMIQHTLSDLMQSLLFQPPAAIAIVKGSAKYPNIQGEVCFFRTPEGTMVVADIKGLPEKAEKCTEGIYGFHIHEGESCTGTAEDPFADAKSHLNPKKCPPLSRRRYAAPVREQGACPHGLSHRPFYN